MCNIRKPIETSNRFSILNRPVTFCEDVLYIPIESSNCNRPLPSRAYDKPSFSTAQLIQVLTPLNESAAIKAFNAAQNLEQKYVTFMVYRLLLPHLFIS